MIEECTVEQSAYNTAVQKYVEAAIAYGMALKARDTAIEELAAETRKLDLLVAKGQTND